MGHVPSHEVCYVMKILLEDKEVTIYEFGFHSPHAAFDYFVYA